MTSFLVVVLGGIGLSGGRGGVLNVVIGTLLIGTMLNGMTIMDVSYSGQRSRQGRRAARCRDRGLIPQSAQRGNRAAGGHLVRSIQLHIVSIHKGSAEGAAKPQGGMS